MMDYEERLASAEDKTALARIYVAALKDSLTAIGRFDAKQLEQVFYDYYHEFSFTKLQQRDQLLGFYSIKQQHDHLWLVHLYIDPACQGGGLGSCVLHSLMSLAQDKPLPIRLTAINGSRANEFYLKNGFALQRTEDSNNHYVWFPAAQ